MKIIEKGDFIHEKLSLDDLKSINGGFCGKYVKCGNETGAVVSTCKPKVGGTDWCWSYTLSKPQKESLTSI